MTRSPDPHDAKRQELRDYCQIAHCRSESGQYFKGIGLCDKHWSAACADADGLIVDYLKENLVEGAILAIDWT